MNTDKTTMPCPACRENGSDKKGNHLTVFPSGKFACAVHPGDKVHNRLIVELRPDLGKDDAFQPAQSKRPISHPRASATSKVRRIEKIPDHVQEGPLKASFVRSYQYEDEQGKPLYAVARYALPPGSDNEKTFRQYPIVEDGYLTGEGCMKGIRLVPYRLSLIGGAETIIVVEGERDAETLEALGYVATCNAGGAEKWRAEWSSFFADKNIVVFPDNDDPGRRHAEQVEAALRPVAKSIKRVTVPEPSKDISDHLEGLSDTKARAAIDELLSVPDPLDALLDARRFDLTSPPPPARSIYRIGTATIATPGNLVVIAAQAKAGKSALVGAFIAAATGMDGDTLGIVSGNTDGRALVHVDSEQSPADHHVIAATALRRVRADVQPTWLRSYRLSDVSTKERFQLLQHELDRARADHGGIHSVLIDGVADLVADPNDSAEAFAAVERLHRLAVTYDTSIVCVLHFNPGSEFNKTRGHLGSQLERKAETNLALEKVDGVTVAYTKLARHAHIEKDAGARFQWDTEAGMHLSCGTAIDEREKQDDFTMQAIVDEIFSDKAALRYSELKQAVMRVRHVKESAAEKTIKKLVPKYARKGLMGTYEKA